MMICAGVFDDYLATYILENKEAILERNRKIVTENLDIVKNWIENEPKVSLIFPKYVSTSFIKLDFTCSVRQVAGSVLGGANFTSSWGTYIEIGRAHV